MASLSGELPTYAPTEWETSTWRIGNATAAAGGLLLVVWSVLVAVLRKRFDLPWRGVAIILSTAIAFAMLGSVVAWSIALPSLA